jgi:hypothetical protein
MDRGESLGISVRVSALRRCPRCFDRFFRRRSNPGLLYGVNRPAALKLSLL